MGGGRIPHEREPLSFHLPVADGACGGREAAVYLVEPSEVTGILTSIALVFYLTQGIISGAIHYLSDRKKEKKKKNKNKQRTRQTLTFRLCPMRHMAHNPQIFKFIKEHQKFMR